MPFCRTRCGYCDFNTYTPSELRIGSAEGELRIGSAEGELRAGPELGATGDAYLTAALAEIDMAGRVLGAYAPPVTRVNVTGVPGVIWSDKGMCSRFATPPASDTAMSPRARGPSETHAG